MINIFKSITFFTVLFALTAFNLSAAEVGVPSPTTGSYTNGTGMTSSPGGYTPTLTWNITRSGDVFTYIYTLSDPTEFTNGFVLQVGSAVVASEIVGANHTFTAPATITFNKLNYLQGLPASVFGIQFTGLNNKNLTFSFTTKQAPIWGNVYAGAEITTRLGTTVDWTYNSLYTTSPTDGRISYVGWVPVPGSITVPEPGILLLLGSTFAAAIVSKRKMQKA